MSSRGDSESFHSEARSSRSGRSWRALLGFWLVLAAGDVRALELEAAPAELIAADIVAAAEAALRGRGNVVDATLEKPKKRGPGERKVDFRVLDDRRADRALLTLQAPASIAGTALLKLPPNIWTWDPEKERHARIMRSAWNEAWLGSDFDVADLLHTDRLVADYRHRLLGIDPKPDALVAVRAYLIESRPRSGSGAKVLHWVAVEYGTPVRREFHTEDGLLARVLRYGDFRHEQGRWFPHRWTALRAGVKGRESEIEVRQVQFDPKFEKDTFSTSRLRAVD